MTSRAHIAPRRPDRIALARGRRCFALALLAFLTCAPVLARADDAVAKPHLQYVSVPTPASDDSAAKQQPPQQRAPRQPSPQKPRPAPLSAEDAALVRELALVENAELLQHLELFDAQAQADEPHASPPARAQSPLR